MVIIFFSLIHSHSHSLTSLPTQPPTNLPTYPLIVCLRSHHRRRLKYRWVYSRFGGTRYTTLQLFWDRDSESTYHGRTKKAHIFVGDWGVGLKYLDVFVLKWDFKQEGIWHHATAGSGSVSRLVYFVFEKDIHYVLHYVHMHYIFGLIHTQHTLTQLKIYFFYTL